MEKFVFIKKANNYVNFRQIRIVNTWLNATYKCKHIWV